MRHTLSSRPAFLLILLLSILVLMLLMMPKPAHGRPTIRASFFAVYTGAVGSRLDNLPSLSGHCGVCHYAFTGAGPKNPYGEAVLVAISAQPNTDAGRQAGIRSIENVDQDGDGYTTLTEITNLSTYSNTPTFPGLKSSNVGSVSGIDVNDILNYLTPTLGADMLPPVVDVVTPNGGESWTPGTSHTVTWTATDNVAVANVDVLYKDGVTGEWKFLARNAANTGALTWFVHNTPGPGTRVRVIARDAAGNQGADSSAAGFTILSAPGGKVPTTLRDFTLPGTQPFGGGTFDTSGVCVTCHSAYLGGSQPGRNFQGSMMAQAGRDPIFFACVTVAEQDAPGAGDLCLRCHMAFGWMRGRSQPTDGSQMISSDRDGVACDLCHRMTDPIYKAGVSPLEDLTVLNLLTPSHTPTNYSNGQFVVDSSSRKRGPFADTVAPHPVLASAFHKTGEFCGTCHDVSNPGFNRVSGADYAPGPLDTAPTSLLSEDILPLERTYSEWKHSAFPAGVYAPDFAGNKADGIVSTCQDCHMPDALGTGCNDPAAPTRPDLPLHDLTGGNYWMPGVVASLYPNETDAVALADGAARAEITLQKAATLGVTCAAAGDSFQATVTVTNRTGHKLPTGYPEGRRMWLEVIARDANGNEVYHSGAYDPATGVLASDPDPVVYEIELGISPALASAIGMDDGKSFHFALNDSVYKDNRIPPAGFTNAAFATFGGAPVDHHVAGTRYADGQNWDAPVFALPPTARIVTAKLYYQTTSKDYVEFLRNENTTNGTGQLMYDAWAGNGRAAPVLMDAESLAVNLTGIADGGPAPAAPRLAVLANPFGSQLSLRLDLGRPTAVRWSVYDVNGRRVASREHGTLGGGAHRIVWDGRDRSGREAGAGIYWIQVQAGEQRIVRQVVRVK
ncbi:MAG TPA: FlgD immunoglobulin-like domain containing protein [Candidatus Eisenbacteria bacterium]|nr:FlgD immunoglobulin-like domain containing protein [Candidatus Eisenbacteria bacterium]